MTGCFIDCNWVIVQFDQGGRLVKAFTYQD
jgi:hypothetical protein